MSPFNQNGSESVISLYIDKLVNRNTTLQEYSYITINSYRSYFKHFDLLSSNSSGIISGHPAYSLLGAYDDPSGPRKVLETGTIIDGRVYILQYEVDSPKYYVYLPTCIAI